MRVTLPRFTNKDAAFLFGAAGSYSRSISLLSSFVHKESGEYAFESKNAAPEDLIYVYDISFTPGFGGLNLDIDNDEDLQALEQAFYALVRMKEEVENGRHEVGKKFLIQRRGKSFYFSLPCGVHRHIPVADGDESPGDNNDPEYRISCNHLVVHVIAADDKYIQVGAVTFYYGIRDALYVSHDLSVLRALMNGADEDEVLRMRPVAHINKMTDDEIYELISTPSCSREDQISEYREMKNEFYRIREKRSLLAPGEVFRLEKAEDKYFSSFPQKCDNHSFLRYA